MVERVFRVFALVVAAFALWPSAASSAAASQPQRIVAVGDLHGDYGAWLDIARAAGLVDKRNRWAGGSTVLVQLGDITDRAPDSLKIIRHLQRLKNEAPRKGGRVIVILGNHEAMNVLGDLRYTDPGEFAAFRDGGSVERRDRVYERNRAQIEAQYRAADPKLTAAAIRQKWNSANPLGWVEHRIAWQPGGELAQWAAANPAVAKIGTTLFVHGGISAEYSKLSIDEINRRAAAAIAAGDDRDQSILNDPLGPLWYRGLATRDPRAEPELKATTVPRPTLDEEVGQVLAAYGARRIVIGHTPILSGITTTGGGRVERVDTGNSRFYGGQLSFLEIVGDRAIPHAVKRSPPVQRGTSR